MNINKLTDGLKAIGLFLLANITGILFILGLAAIVYAFFLIGTVAGYMATGVALIIITLILGNEQDG